jgi:dolichyl-phosphate beta-glucosyltransferase
MSKPYAAIGGAASPANEPEIHVSFVIPAYNEANRIGSTLRRMCDYFAGQKYTHEIIVVDDGSVDSTADVVRREYSSARVMTHQPNQGKGYAVKRGMLAARGRYRFYYDADGSTPIAELDKAWPLFEKGADIVIGSRSLPESDVQVRQNLMRQSMGRTYNKIVKLLLREKMIDTQCGFKGFTAESTETVFRRQTMTGFAFDAELLYIARKHRLRIAEMPIRWLNSPDSRVSMFRDSLNMLTDVLRVRLRDWRGAYR